jgi:hypothetical protein
LAESPRTLSSQSGRTEGKRRRDPYRSVWPRVIWGRFVCAIRENRFSFPRTLIPLSGRCRSPAKRQEFGSVLRLNVVSSESCTRAGQQSHR